MVLALEMEDDDEELESLVYETNGRKRSVRGVTRSHSGSPPASPSRKASLVFGIGAVVAVVVLYLVHGNSGETQVDVPDIVDKAPHVVVGRTAPTTPIHLGGSGDAAAATATTDSAPTPSINNAVSTTDDAATTKNNDHNHNAVGVAPVEATPTTTTDDTTIPTGTTAPLKNGTDLLYSHISRLPVDPFHGPLDEAKTKLLRDRWGQWKFWDGAESERNSDEDYCGKFPHRDIPADDLPDTAWQADAVFVNHLLNDGEQLIGRAMEAIFVEYGHGKPLPPAGLADRMQMFHWEELTNLSSDTTTVPKRYTKRGDRGTGGWTTGRSRAGLVKRLLHAMHTNDDFVMVLGGHSAAAGHGNHLHQSYAHQAHKILAPILARLGVRLVTRNLSQGGLGTLQNALGAGSLYGNNIDVLLWDCGMTEGSKAHIDLFARQGMLGGVDKVPIVWGGSFDVLRALHEEAEADVGEFGTAQQGVIPVQNETHAKDVPYASRYLACAHDRQDLCNEKPRFCAKCWVDRSDLDPETLFDKIDAKPGSQVKWHPGWRVHQIVGRNLAFSILSALQEAIQIWSDGTMGGPPLDDDWWHVTDYYANIQTKLRAMQSGACVGIEEHLPARMCTTAMQARSLFTPRAHPAETSLSTIVVPAASGWVPVNEAKNMYDGPDVHNPCDTLPEDGVDVLAIVSGRRRRRQLEDESSSPTSPSLLEPRKVVSFGLEDRPVYNATVRTLPSSSTHRSLVTNKIVPGEGWQVIDEPPGECNGEYGAICDRRRTHKCPMLGHHDYRGMLIGNELAGWLVMELPKVQHGLVVLKLVTYFPEEANTRTNGWTTVNNDANGRRILLHDAEHEQQPQRRRLGPAEQPDTFEFDYAIDGVVTTLSKEEFMAKLTKPQRVIETLTILDDANYKPSNEDGSVQVAFRMRGCGRTCAFGLSHIYWA